MNKIFILKIFNNTLVKPRYVISWRSKIVSMPNFLICAPPTDKYSIYEFWDMSFAITVEANLSPDGSPVKMNIFFI